VAFISVGAFFLTLCVQRQCDCLSCLTPERRVAQKEGCSRQDRKMLLTEWRFFWIDANIPLPHVYFGKRLQLTHKTQVCIRWKWPPRYTGKPQDDIEIKKCRTLLNGIIMRNLGKQENGRKWKDIAERFRFIAWYYCVPKNMITFVVRKIMNWR